MRTPGSSGVLIGAEWYYTDSEGQKVENPRYFRKAERKVAQVQRQVSRPERAAQADQTAKSLTQAQPLPQRAAGHQTTSSTAPALAYPPQDRPDHTPQPAVRAGEQADGQVSGQASGQPEYPARARKTVPHLSESTEAI